MIYFIACPAADAVKIGTTNGRPFERLNQAQVNCPHELRLLAVAEGNEAIEAQLHRRFAHLRIRGEWFKLAGEISAHIALLPEPAKPPRGWWGQKRNRMISSTNSPAAPELLARGARRSSLGARPFSLPLEP